MEYGAAREGRVRSVDGSSLFFRKTGSGPAVILCDGLMCEGHVWKYLVPALSDRWEVAHWNYPGHGRSEDPATPYDLSPERLADDAAEVIAASGNERAAIAGHSLGVQVALEVWRRHRDLVDCLILVCGSPGKIVRDFHESALLQVLLPLLGTASRFLPDQTARLWRRLPGEGLVWLAMHTREVNRRLIRAGDLAEYLTRLTRVDFRVGLAMLEAAGHHDATPYLGEIDVPALVIAGREDRFTPPRRSEQIASLVPGAELMMVPGGTHSLPLEQPELVNLRIRRFLSESLRR